MPAEGLYASRRPTVRRNDTSYTAVSVQPTIELNRFVVSDWEAVEGVEEAIEANDEMEDDRKAYLIEMRAKWEEQLAEEREE